VSGDAVAEMEARIQMELNKKLASINTYLQEHAEACEKIDMLRDCTDFNIRHDMDGMQKKLEVGLRLLDFSWKRP